MFGDVWPWAGSLRTRELNRGSAPHHLATDPQNMLDDLAAWKRTGMVLHEQAVRLHHQAVRIHPFMNGNGRWARLLANIWLRLHSAPPIEWPEPIIGSASTIRDDYIAAIKAADELDFAPLTNLHEKFSGQAD